MVGDVNVFYHGDDKVEGEIEVMIAEEGSRRKGIATEAVQLMMGYGAMDHRPVPHRNARPSVIQP